MKVAKFTVPDGIEDVEAEVSAGMGCGAAVLRPLRRLRERILKGCC